MDKITAVARREFLATVRTKAFLLTVVMMPAIMLGAIYGTKWVQELTRKEKLPTRHLAVVDQGGVVFTDLSREFDNYNADRANQQFALERIPPAEADTEKLTARVQDGELYGYMIVSADAVAGEGGCVLARKDNQLQTGQILEAMIRNAVIAVRWRNEGIDPQRSAALRDQAIPITRWDAKTGEPVSSNELARAITPFAFMFLLFMGTFGISQGLLTTLIEEKSSRVVEVLLSALSPTQLMAGKILGTVLVGFLLITVWGSVGFWSAQGLNLGDLVTGYRLLLALLYFVPGFLLMASLLAGIGASCNELKEAQSMVFPLSVITIIPMIFWFYIAEHPASLFSIVLSYIPPITPFVMILRVCADPDTPLWQIVTTLAVLWVSVFLAIWAAGKVFRVGVLMYGKPPSLKELVRWVWHS
ncbi:MAG: ABC transporter permease [Phycisphaerae bacterium]|nr:ABC transporter permease [Phycisphaerae bacterium]